MSSASVLISPKMPLSCDNRGMRNSLRIGGFTPFSSTDYPGKLAAVVFVQGCPWRCSYCHNTHLQERGTATEQTWDAIRSFLSRRTGLIDAVVFSGGEATMDPALALAMKEVRELGFQVGLHTACIYPKQLERVLPLLNWVGFDVKAPLADYAAITGVQGSDRAVHQCAEMILASGVDYECRTTIHPTLLSEQKIMALALELSAIGVQYYVLQKFRTQGCQTKALNQALIADYPSLALQEKIRALFSTLLIRA